MLNRLLRKTKLQPGEFARNLFGQFANMTIEQRRLVVSTRMLNLKWVEIPVDLDTFVMSKHFLGHSPLSAIQREFVFNGSEIFDIEAAKSDLTQVVFRDDQPIELVAIWGKSSGKDTCSMVIIARVLYLLGCLSNPQAVFGMPAYSGIDILNMAVSADQASAVFFNPLKRLIQDSPWFMEKLCVHIANDVIQVPPIIGHDEKKGDLYAINAWSGSGSHESHEGKNLLVCVLDEIDAFRVKKSGGGGKALANMGGATAHSMYDAMTSSVQSRFPKYGKMILLSWPRYAGSFIMKRAAEGKIEPGVFVSGPYSTWEVNPMRTKEDFDLEFRRNPERARAKYMAQPGLVIDRYFTDAASVLRAFHADQNESLDICRSVSDPGRESPVDYEMMQLIPARLKADPQSLYCWHCDLGLKKDRAALAMAHHSGYVFGQDGQPLPVVALDLLIYWQARNGLEISFSEIRQVLLSVIRLGFRTSIVTLDGWQSVDFRQIVSGYDQRGIKIKLDREGKPIRTPIISETFSLDSNTAGYDTLKEVLYEQGRFDGFYCKIVVEELLGLVMVNAKKVDHLEDAGKDLADAVAGATFNALRYPNEHLAMSQYRQEKVGRVMVGVSEPGSWNVDDPQLSISGKTEGKKRPKMFG